jgi:hypothetical protein
MSGAAVHVYSIYLEYQVNYSDLTSCKTGSINWQTALCLTNDEMSRLALKTILHTHKHQHSTCVDVYIYVKLRVFLPHDITAWRDGPVACDWLVAQPNYHSSYTTVVQSAVWAFTLCNPAAGWKNSTCLILATLHPTGCKYVNMSVYIIQTVVPTGLVYHGCTTGCIV